MKTIRNGAALLLAACIAHPVTALADDALVRGMIGLGAAIIANEAQKNQPRQQPQQRTYSPRYAQPYDPRAAERREVQRRLNALGFDAGHPDGIYGPQTRRAIAAFQRSIGHDGDGAISQQQIAILYNQSENLSGRQAYADNGGGQAPGADGQGSGGFPVIAAPGQQPAQDGAGGFPVIAAPGQQPAQAGAGGFPALGSAAPGGDASSGGSAFPALGAPAQGGQTGSAPAFPKLGGAQASAEGDAMPALGAPAAAAEGAPDMPSLGETPAQQGGAFPTLASAAQPEAADMPALSAPGGEAMAANPDVAPDAVVAEGETTTLEAEIARTGFATPDGQPDVRGVSLGQSRADTIAAFDAMDYGSCAKATTYINCSRSNDSLSDEITVWSAPDGPNWAILRRISFTQPAPAEPVRAQFSGNYPALMDEENGMIASRAACTAGSMSGDRFRTILQEMAQTVDHQAAASDTMLDFARRCPLVYSLDLEPGGADAVAAATIVFIDASLFIDTANALSAAAAAAETPERDKLADQLKL